MTELRANGLRFTPTEVAAFLNDVIEVGLSAEDIAALDAPTEGWIAGLQLAALSMLGRRDVSAFVKAFSGSHHFVLDYLVEKALDRQSCAIQVFLLRTSILDRLTGPLCDVVTGRDDSRTILIQLEQANLLLVPLDDERRWYRYHHLFADLLRGRLAQTQPKEVLALHRQASEWYEQNKLIAEAVSHALAAGDVDRVAHLAEGNVLAMMDHGQLTTLVRWLKALPEEVVRSRPWLCVAQAWPSAYAGQRDAVEPLLQHAETALTANEPALSPSAGLGMNFAEGQHIAGHIAAIRAYLADLGGDKPREAALAREALEYLPEEDLRARGFATSLLVAALYWSGDLVAATQASTEAIAISQASGDSHAAVRVPCELAAPQFAQGQLRKAAATCRHALGLADEHFGRGGWRLPAAGLAHVTVSHVLREWNDLEAAARHAREGVELCSEWGQAEDLIHGYVCLARVLQVIGDSDGALDAIQEAVQVASSVSPYFVGYAAAHQARLYSAQGDSDQGRLADAPLR